MFAITMRAYSVNMPEVEQKPERGFDTQQLNGLTCVWPAMVTGQDHMRWP